MYFYLIFFKICVADKSKMFTMQSVSKEDFGIPWAKALMTLLIP